MKDSQIVRYSRQLLVGGFELEGQQRLLDARVLIVGLGGLGCTVAWQLAAAGVGHLLLADSDTVELSNLHRQQLYDMQDLGNLKTQAAAAALKSVNPEVKTELLPAVDESNAEAVTAQADLVIDATDNFNSRQILNRYCFSNQKVLISAAAEATTGQLLTFDFSNGCGPCYRCLYQEVSQRGRSCNDEGIFPAVVNIMGAAQALEAIKQLSGFGTPLTHTLLIFDALQHRWRRLEFAQDPVCLVCVKKRSDTA